MLINAITATNLFISTLLFEVYFKVDPTLIKTGSSDIVSDSFLIFFNAFIFKVNKKDSFFYKLFKHIFL